ncbi:hypothetical protein LOK74_17805 [Brevibacillus humidisoli]|uniref:AIR synthase related protein n=1 Tax=Brevibacillus humidisoli TaxID=2895522 RepID=UPI001E4E93A7|nr:AIR synthase related protein [Brevibacillus humidisoli]UFJ39887.1 hypothetical protein LOK74_17805 [Brevibacillus humidisoli]
MRKRTRFRDLTVIDYLEKRLVIACDSSGAIGDKQHDVVKVDPYILGRFLVRVPLMELLSVGAVPLTVCNTLSVEMEPTGRSIIAGIFDEMRQIGMEPEAALNGSTEDNIPTVQTGAGVTVIGEADRLMDKSMAGDVLCCIGYPKVGQEVGLEDPDICDLLAIKRLREMDGIHEIVPVGSKGIRYELEELLKRNQLTLLGEQVDLPLEKSGGPGTCVIVTARADVQQWRDVLGQPVTVLGVLKN